MSYRFFHTPATARSINSLLTEELFKPILYALNDFLKFRVSWREYMATCVHNHSRWETGDQIGAAGHFLTPEKTLSALTKVK